MSRTLLFILVILVIAIPFAGCAPNYDDSELSRLNATEVTGFVTEQSRGSFILRDDTGTEQTYRTSQGTQYIPAAYRSQQDDKVIATYITVSDRSGRSKLSVLKLEALEVPEKNKPPEAPMKGVIISSSRGSSRHVRAVLFEDETTLERFHIYIPNKNSILTVKGYDKDVEKYDWFRIDGKKAEVKIKHVPILRGNGYVYEAEHLTLF